MYDAQQGSTSGAHIDLSTASGTNTIHGQLYGHRGTDWLNAAPFFFNQDPNIPANEKVPELHRYTAGGTVGGPIIKNKLFGFISYQHVRDSDEQTGHFAHDRAVRLHARELRWRDSNRRASGGLSRQHFQCQFLFYPGRIQLGTGANQISLIALGMFLYQMPNGQYLIL